MKRCVVFAVFGALVVTCVVIVQLATREDDSFSHVANTSAKTPDGRICADFFRTDDETGKVKVTNCGETSLKLNVKGDNDWTIAPGDDVTIEVENYAGFRADVSSISGIPAGSVIFGGVPPQENAPSK